MRVIMVTVILILFLNAALVICMIMANNWEGMPQIEDEEDQRRAILEWQERRKKRKGPGSMDNTSGHAFVHNAETHENPQNNENRRGLFGTKE